MNFFFVPVVKQVIDVKTKSPYSKTWTDVHAVPSYQWRYWGDKKVNKFYSPNLEIINIFFEECASVLVSKTNIVHIEISANFCTKYKLNDAYFCFQLNLSTCRSSHTRIMWMDLSESNFNVPTAAHQYREQIGLGSMKRQACRVLLWFILPSYLQYEVTVLSIWGIP